MNKTGVAFLVSFIVGSLAHGLSAKFEKVPPGEEQTIQALIAKISEDVKNTGARDAHAKDHGCVDGITVKVKDNLGDLQVGAFKEPGHEYSAILRSSHGSGNPKASDNEKGGHGFALKIFLDKDKDKELREQVTRLPGEEFFIDENYYKTLDIITINGLHEFMVSTVADYPEFFAAVGGMGKLNKQIREGKVNPADFGNAAPIVANIKNQMEAGTFKPESMATIAPAFLNALYWHLPGPNQTPDPAFKQRPTEAGLMGTLSQLVTYDALDTSYQSWVSSLLGQDHAVKYQFRPVACANANPADLKGEALMNSLGVKDDPNRLTATLKARLTQSEVCYELAVHVLKDGSEALVEQAEKAWPGRDEPGAYKAVATITIPQKKAGEELVDPKLCEMISMNPGHSPLDHKPLGGIQRGRQPIYAAIETLRNKVSGNKPIESN